MAAIRPAVVQAMGAAAAAWGNREYAKGRQNHRGG